MYRSFSIILSINLKSTKPLIYAGYRFSFVTNQNYITIHIFQDDTIFFLKMQIADDLLAVIPAGCLGFSHNL